MLRLGTRGVLQRAAQWSAVSAHQFGRSFATVRFTPAHEWIAMDGKIGTVGITDYAQSELGDVVHVELPSVGDNYDQGACFGVVESVKAASDVYMPLDGKILAINDELENDPSKLNKDPEASAWMIKIEATQISQFDKMMDKAEYMKYLKSKKDDSEK
eukprot:gb/GEZN01016348.1/.p1 GENE.gb/GEZN01016348.1/~~gb/GEZN01016348.1/.p1  ORF type:complete len:158 (-),score=25.48 gb/GEZN01016348.1/:315-788(-)